MFETQVDTFLKELNSCQNVIILAGSGMSVDSGLPDYRGDDGFWKRYKPFQYKNVNLSSVSNPSFFKKDPSKQPLTMDTNFS